jgi:predicted dehydrogenase
MPGPFNRRDFTNAALAGSVVGAAPTVARAGRVIGANDRVRIACIGVGNRGVQDLHAFLAQKDAEIVALCDVYEPYLNGQFDKIHPHFKELTYRVPAKLPDFGGPVERHKDFRRILDRKDVDAVIIATPDHWHALQTIMACDAGKDVFVEKPLSITVREGRRMVDAARRTNRVVQVGTQ